MKYYVVYKGKDVGWYRISYCVMFVTENEEVAKDFCEKFRCDYSVEEVGSDRATHSSVGLFIEEERD